MTSTPDTVQTQFSLTIHIKSLPYVLQVLTTNSGGGIRYIMRGMYPIEEGKKAIIWIDECGVIDSPYRREQIIQAIGVI